MAYKQAIKCVIAMVVCHLVLGDKPAGWIDGKHASDIIKNLTESSLGSAHLQQAFDDQTFIEDEINGTVLLEKLSSSISERFTSTFMAVQNLKQTIEQEYSNNNFNEPFSTNDNSQCCKIDSNGMEDSLQFKTKIDANAGCFKFSKDAKKNAKLPYSERVRDTMKSNLQDNKFLKWQYFGSVDGLLVTYPKRVEKDHCDDDPRFQKWYVESAASDPKDIVFVMDRSESMEGNRLEIAKEAANIVVETLNAEDRVGMVAFSSQVKTPKISGINCYTEQLAFATRENKNYLSQWINQRTAHGATYYREAFEKAFELLGKYPHVSSDPRPRKRLILFLTDGVPVDKYNDTLNLISTENAKLNNSAIIFTYGIGNEINGGPKIQDFLRDISNQTHSNATYGPITPGTFTAVSDENELRSILGTYYNAISSNQNSIPIVSTPHVDFSGLGLIFSVCLPVYPDGLGLKGVACIDLSVTEVFADAIYLSHGGHSYTFVTDYKGRTILHPLLPNELNYGYTVPLRIHDLEVDVDVRRVIEKMIRGDAGDEKVESTFTMARGSTKTDGVITQKLESEYHWQMIPMTNFSLCVVRASADRNITFKDKTLHSKDFVYHRLDLVEDVEKCKSNKRLSTQEHSVVKLTEFAFKNPITYVNQVDRKETVNEYKVFLETKSESPDDNLKDITKYMLAISETLDSIWTTKGAFDLFVVWRYYGDYFGSIRIFPGNSLRKEYDQTKRGWFVKAISNPGSISLTTPYNDSFGAGIVFTIAVPIKIGRSNGHKQDDQILGVAAMDFQISYIEFLLETEYKRCTDDENICFIVDSSGYLVYHETIDYKSGNDLRDHHITELEPDIATFLLLSHDFKREDPDLKQESCVEFGDKRQLFTWRLNRTFAIHNYEKAPYFDLEPVAGTNIYLGIRKANKTNTNTCDCPNGKSSAYKCEDKNDECRCPCYMVADYDFCNNTFTKNTDSQDTCVPQPASILFKSPIPDEKTLISGLADCLERNCEELTQSLYEQK